MTATVGTVEAASDTVFVFTIDRDGLEVVAEAVTDEHHESEYSFTDLPPGEYLLVAGADGNSDGGICETGDLCCAWPTLIEPSAIALEQRGALTGLDFPVARRLPRQAASAPERWG